LPRALRNSAAVIAGVARAMFLMSRSTTDAFHSAARERERHISSPVSLRDQRIDCLIGSRCAICAERDHAAPVSVARSMMRFPSRPRHRASPARGALGVGVQDLRRGSVAIDDAAGLAHPSWHVFGGGDVPRTSTSGRTWARAFMSPRTAAPDMSCFIHPSTWPA
jgi:hypothetical protein